MDAVQAIYPTLIIVLVSLEQSGFEPVLSDKPMPHTPSHPSTLPQSPYVLARLGECVVIRTARPTQSRAEDTHVGTFVIS